jgi:hypothetical protein
LTVVDIDVLSLGWNLSGATFPDHARRHTDLISEIIGGAGGVELRVPTIGRNRTGWLGLGTPAWLCPVGRPCPMGQGGTGPVGPYQDVRVVTPSSG